MVVAVPGGRVAVVPDALQVRGERAGRAGREQQVAAVLEHQRDQAGVGFPLAAAFHALGERELLQLRIAAEVDRYAADRSPEVSGMRTLEVFVWFPFRYADPFFSRLFQACTAYRKAVRRYAVGGFRGEQDREFAAVLEFDAVFRRLDPSVPQDFHSDRILQSSFVVEFVVEVVRHHVLVLEFERDHAVEGSAVLLIFRRAWRPGEDF